MLLSPSSANISPTHRVGVAPDETYYLNVVLLSGYVGLSTYWTDSWTETPGSFA